MTSPNARKSTRMFAAARHGFTLIEVMIVILIVLALGGLVAYNLLGTKEDAENKLCKIDMNTLEQALKQYRFDHGRYPTDDEGLEVLWNKEKLQDEEEAKKWRKLLEQPMAKDRFGNEWGYRQVSEHGEEDKYDLWSYGRDKQEGTADDINSWKSEEGTGGNSGTTPSGNSGGSGGGGGGGGN
jgi:general secretion pathway protein G